MDNEQLNKSIDTLIEEFFAEPVKKSDDLNVAAASKTTADAAIAAAPGMEDDAARGAGRPKQMSDVPKNDEDGARAKEYDGAISSDLPESENEEAKKQAKSIDQTSSAGRMGEGPKMKDPRLTKSLTDEEYAEFEAFKKAKADAAEKAKQDDLRKSEQLKKAETETLIKAAVETALSPLKKQHDDLKKSYDEQSALIKAMASQPVRSKSITSIDVIEKAKEHIEGENQEFSKSEKLDAAERLVMKKSLPLEAVVELENTGTLYRKDWQQLVEAELQKQN